MTRVVVVDDELHLARALRRQLTDAGHEVAVAHDGLGALDLVATVRPHVVVLDLNLPDMTGVEVIRRLRGWFSAPVLVLSALSEEWQKVAALEAGADDYLVKPFGVRELRARVSALLRRPTAGTVDLVQEFGDLRVHLGTRAVTVEGREVRLTPTEWRLLEGFVSHPGKLLSHRWLLEHAWRDGYGEETREALRVHIRGLRAKLGDPAATPRYIRTESGAGYRWVGAGDVDGGPTPAAATAVSDAPTADGTGPAGLRAVAHDVGNTLSAVQLIAWEVGTDRAMPEAERVAQLERLDALVNEAAERLRTLREGP